MHALVVVAHPEPSSLSQAIGARIAAGIAQSGHTAEIADLAAEGFDPRFTPADLAVHRRRGPAPADVVRERTRIDRADALVLVYPVYWWSIPALLKGWIDRVFSNGWAFDFSLGGRLEKKLRRLQVQLVAVAGADAHTYARHGYFGAMKLQIDHGIFDYCGARVIGSELLLESETRDPQVPLAAAGVIGQGLFSTTGKQGEQVPCPASAA
ncbi:NAD(P)H-dependent oxidoreductase [Luteimonas sp. BDR2-5]|uniref:NAD(P)H-dependent oxidoreductase n=1 Tax=Proluteimonas luteida TaxID=2878685 RepID=UPI001E53EFD3|nr:NAD(P)H-dependent oxidoreductase [Luteimonas sp. BDR2-5]MCD9027895.1 NAD(P)H-dependent oxidoreductase [Luteimonas sp. BDR2-5]